LHTRAVLRFVALNVGGNYRRTLAMRCCVPNRGLEAPPGAVSRRRTPEPPAAPKTAPPTVTNLCPAPKKPRRALSRRCQSLLHQRQPTGKPAPGRVLRSRGGCVEAGRRPAPSRPSCSRSPVPRGKSAALRRRCPAREPCIARITVIRGCRCARSIPCTRESNEPNTPLWAAITSGATVPTRRPSGDPARSGLAHRDGGRGRARSSTELVFVVVRGRCPRAPRFLSYYVPPSALILLFAIAPVRSRGGC